MKTFIVLALCVAAALAVPVEKSPAVTLRDYYANNPGTRIIGGSPAAAGQIPYQVANTFVQGGGSYFCGGSLISANWVLSAAHCAIGATSFTISAGSTTLTGADANRVQRATTTAFVHAGYNPNNLNNDISLIFLAEAIPFNQWIQPANLPSPGSIVGAGVTVRVSGWGLTADGGGSVSNILNFVQLTTIPNAQCAAVYGSAVVVSSTICAVGNPYHSTCSGDSGGPLVIENPGGSTTQVGIVSFVHVAGCASGNPSGYVRTESFLPWINSITGGV